MKKKTNENIYKHWKFLTQMNGYLSFYSIALVGISNAKYTFANAFDCIAPHQSVQHRLIAARAR